MTGPANPNGGWLDSHAFLVVVRFCCIIGPIMAIPAGIMIYEARADLKAVIEGFNTIRIEMAVIKSQMEANNLNDIVLRKRVDRLEYRSTQ